MQTYSLIFKTYGESAVLIEWPKEINNAILFDICSFAERIKESSIDGIIDINHVYSSLLITFNSDKLGLNQIIIELKRVYNKRYIETSFKSKTIQFPVCYDSEFSPDLKLILEVKQMEKKEFITLHTSIEYTIYGIGFLPGFLYLGGLPKKLFFPRKVTPNLNVLKGSVAIGGQQTGVYPQDSPGGWHIIGKTPISLFDSSKERPSFLRAGDKIKFYPIQKKEFESIKIQVENDNYRFKQILND